MKQFLNSESVQLINGGYLSNKEGAPVYNAAFVAAQKHAEYIVTFAEKAKGKDFTGKEADSLADLENEVRAALAEKATKFVTGPSQPEKKLTEQLAEEAKSFMTFQKESSKTDKINEFLQQFAVLAEFEEFGLFFEDEIVKLNKIYTMKEVIASVEAVIDLLK